MTGTIQSTEDDFKKGGLSSCIVTGGLRFGAAGSPKRNDELWCAKETGDEHSADVSGIKSTERNGG